MATRKSKKRVFSKCHPASRKTRRCLPANIYASVPTGTCRSSSDSDHCILDHAPLPDAEKQRLRREYLRPRYPNAWTRDPDMWLDNYNIEACMRQYEIAYPWFSFLGVFPIDFSAPNPYKKGSLQCLHPELCNLNFKTEYTRGIRAIGAVFNLDPHFKGGSHWVALYIDFHDLKKPWAAYFDSYGYRTPRLIARLMRSFTQQAPAIKLMYNARRFQYGGSECGMYSMFFIIQMIGGVPFKEFCKTSVPDATMLQLRNVLFSH